jgi:hypothetical protein
MNFTAYLIGYIIFVAGLAWLAVTMGAPQEYVTIGAVILAGLGIMSAVVRTRRREGGESDGDVTVVKK